MNKWSLLALARFLLASGVAFSHLEHLGKPWAVQIGFEAVLGFLLISGYSIGSSYIKEPEGFLKRRALRIYPVYLGALVLACALQPLPLSWHSAWTIIQNLFFLNQLTTHDSIIPPAWSLSLEVWLYCLTPWLAKLSASRLRMLMYASFVLFCAHEIGRTVFHFSYYAGIGYGINLPLLSFAWLAGFVIAREPTSAKRTLRDCAAMFASYMALSVSIHVAYLIKHQMLGWFDLASDALRAGVLLGVVALFQRIVSERTGRTKNATMLGLGDVSYPLYLVHLPIYLFLADIGIRSSWASVTIALLTAYLFYRLLDFYSQRPRERLTASVSA